MAEIDTTSAHYKGKFNNIYEVNKAFPNGGTDGDYVDILGWAHYWNADRGIWSVNEQRDSYWDELWALMSTILGNIKTYIYEIVSDLLPEEYQTTAIVVRINDLFWQFVPYANTPVTFNEETFTGVFGLTSTEFFEQSITRVEITDTNASIESTRVIGTRDTDTVTVKFGDFEMVITKVSEGGVAVVEWMYTDVDPTVSIPLPTSVKASHTVGAYRAGVTTVGDLNGKTIGTVLRAMMFQDTAAVIVAAGASNSYSDAGIYEVGTLTSTLRTTVRENLAAGFSFSQGSWQGQNAQGQSASGYMSKSTAAEVLAAAEYGDMPGVIYHGNNTTTMNVSWAASDDVIYDYTGALNAVQPTDGSDSFGATARGGYLIGHNAAYRSNSTGGTGTSFSPSAVEWCNNEANNVEALGVSYNLYLGFNEASTVMPHEYANLWLPVSITIDNETFAITPNITAKIWSETAGKWISGEVFAETDTSIRTVKNIEGTLITYGCFVRQATTVSDCQLNISISFT